jgi:hypothetical protein
MGEWVGQNRPLVRSSEMIDFNPVIGLEKCGIEVGLGKQRDP